MSRALQTLAALALLGVCSASSAWTQTHPKTGYQPAELSSAAGIEYPVNTVAMGAVVFELTVDESGAVQSVQPVREIPSLTEPAMRAIKSWHFKPAMMDGDPVQSRVTIVVMFNPPQNPPVNPLPARSSSSVAARPHVQPDPPEIVSAIYATYPMTSAVKKGTVVLRVAIGDSGDVEDVKPLRDVPPLTSAAIDAVKKWQFRPAEMSGRRVASSVVAAFVFESPLTHSY
jgi:TonB family protein